MPNDPRVKFKKKMYDMSRNIIHFQGSGGGRLQSIFEDGTPPPDPGGGGETGGGGGTGGGGTGGGVTPREAIPQVEKPSLNPGEITGITIGSIAVAAALAATIEEQRRRQRGGRGMQPVPQREDLSSRQSGLELISTRRRAPANFAPLNSESGSSSRSNSFDSARSGLSTTDLQSARSRPSSGASTPDRDLTSFRPNARGFQQQPSALAPVAPIAPPPQRPNVPLNLIQDIEARQLEIRMPTTSGGRIKTLQNEINILEEQIRVSGTPYTSLEERINLAMNTQLPKPALAPAPVPVPAPAPVSEIIPPIDQLKQLKSEITLIENQIVTETNLSTKNAMKEQLKILKKQATTLEKTMPSAPAPAPVERPAPPADSIASRTRSRTNPQVNEQLELIKTQEGINRLQAKLPQTDRAFDVAQIAQGDLAQKGNVPKQEIYLKGRLTSSLNKLDKTLEELELRLLNPNLTPEQRTTLVAQQERIRRQITTIEEGPSPPISKTVTAEVNTRVSAPTNDSIRATQPTREFESRMRPVAEIEMRPLQKEYFPDLKEIVQAAMQQMGSRKPLNRARVAPVEPSVAGRAALERANALSTDARAPTLNELRATVGQTEPLKFTSTMKPKEYSEFRNQAELTAGKAALERSKARLSGLERPPPAERPAPERPPPAERPAPERPAPERPTPTAPIEIATETSVDRFNNFFNKMVEGQVAAGYEVPEAPPGLQGIEKQKHIMDEIIREHQINEREFIGGTNDRVISPEEAFGRIQTQYEKALNDPRTQRPVEAIRPEEHIGTATPKGKKRLIKGKGLLATGDQRPMQTALTGEASRATLRPTQSREATTTRTTAPEARAAAPEMITAPETMSARSILAPEVSARVPLLTTPEPAGPRVRAQVQSINTTGKPVIEPTGTPGASPPPSAPGSGTATPQEGATVERTATERASLAEEVSAGLTKKPGRQKARTINGKNKITVNPLERFVAPEFRNAPNIEIHPGSKTLMGSLSELGARVPRLVPTRQVLLNAGHTALAEGGGAVAGFYAGSAAGQAMNKYFATHPPKDRGDEFGQALATSMVALGVGNVVSKVVTYVIKQGARVAMGAQVAGSISSASTAFGTAILEAAVFAAVATTTQYFTTKAMEDAGYNHQTSRMVGSFAATEALLGLEFVSFISKGANPAAFASFVVSELFILGFGIWSLFEEMEEGRLQDVAEEEQREQIEAERVAALEERRIGIANINRTNSLRAAFMIGLETHDYNFDAMYNTLTDEEKIAMGILTPEAKAVFQRQVESAFDPLGMFAEPSTGLVVPEVLTPLEQQRRDVFNSYINYYIAELRGENPPPFNFDDPKVQELNDYSGGTWQSAAQVTATTNHMQTERVHPLILNAQNEIINAFHNERKTIEDMPDDVVAYANLDSNFRANYEAYIIADAAAQILLEFNNTQHGYNDVDPALLAIADRDPTFRAAADAYYQTLANQARDFNLPISKIVELNALMENDQAIEVGKLNDARNAIIQKNMAENQAAIDSYNANIIRSINIYGDNFEAIIRNINEQSLLSGHTFLYASNKADLYRQLHLEMPELELIDPDDEITDNALWKPGKGRKVGDTALYGFRHKLTDEQNQELEDMIASGEISRQDEVYQAALIRERDRYLYVETDQERADDLGMSLTDYHAKYGITIDIYDMEIVDYTLDSDRPENGRIRMPDGSIRTYRDGELVNIQSAPLPIIVAYDPALAQQPDGDITMPDGSVRTYKNGLVTEVLYSGLTPPQERLSPTEINAQIDATRGPTYAQLKTMYPEAYQRLQLKYANDPDGDAKIESTLARGHKDGLYYPGGATREDGDPIPEPTEPPQLVSTVLFNGQREMPDGTTRSYKNGKVISIGYPAGFPVSQMITDLKTLNRNEGNYYESTPVTPVTPTTPVSPVLFNGERAMPDGTTRSYKNGKLMSISYPANYPTENKLDAYSIVELNKREGDYYDPNPSTPVTPVTPTPTEPLKNGIVNMPDGSIRTYKNGLVVYVEYEGNPFGKTPKQINEQEGVQNATYTGRTETPVTPVAPTAPLQQGLVKMPDGSKRMYKDGKVVSVVYPPGVNGPTLNEINAAEGTKTAVPDSNNPVNPAPVDPGGLPSQIQTPTQPDREPTYEELQVMYPAKYQTYTRSYADAGKYNLTPPSPEEQAMMIEGLLRAEHTDRTQAGTAAPLPPPTQTTTPTPPTNQPLPMVPGAKSYEYADSGTQVAPTPTPTTTTPSGAGPSDYRPRQQEPMQYNAPAPAPATSLARQAPAQTISPAAIPPS